MAFEPELMKIAKSAISKRAQFAPRPAMFLRLSVVQKLMRLAIKHRDRDAAMLYLASYAFLLRVPSEAFSIAKYSSGVVRGENSVMYVCDNQLHLKLLKRKNKQHGSLLKRACWCDSCKETCPVHVLGKFIEELPEGEQPFRKFSPGIVLEHLRARLKVLKIEDWWQYRSHDFRRGHARDLQARGAHLYEIFAAGEWRSPAFLKYMDLMELEKDIVVEAHIEESSEDEKT